MIKDINRLKVVLVEKKKTVKWLAGELGLSPTTVSKWCSNATQPKLQTLSRIAEILEVDVRTLLISSCQEEDVILIRADKFKELSGQL